jgi:hypothetical protein
LIAPYAQRGTAENRTHAAASRAAFFKETGHYKTPVLLVELEEMIKGFQGPGGQGSQYGG